MDGDAYRDMSHYEMQQFIWRKVATFADYANIEQRLDNGKIADVFYQVGRTTVIVEVKTKLRQHLIESAWLKYHDHCQYLAIACPPQPYCADQGSFTGGWNVEKFERVGIWLVEWRGLTESRPAARLDVKTPGLMVIMSQASSPFTAIGSPACAADAP